MNVILKVTVLFALIIALSFLIERLLEILRSIYDLLDSRFNWHTFWTRMATWLKDRLEKRLRVFEYVEPKDAAVVLHRFRETVLNEQGGYAGTVPVISGDLVRTLSIKVLTKFIAIILGIRLAFWMNIDLLCIWQEAAGDSYKWVSNIVSQNLRIVLSGIVMGLGSSPVHKIVTTLDKKRQKRTEKGV